MWTRCRHTQMDSETTGVCEQQIVHNLFLYISNAKNWKNKEKNDEKKNMKKCRKEKEEE